MLLRLTPGKLEQESQTKNSSRKSRPPRDGPQRTASEAAAGEASQRRRPGRGPCRAGPCVQPISARRKNKPCAILSQPVYAGFGPTLAAEYLSSATSSAAMRGWMAAAGLSPAAASQDARIRGGPAAVAAAINGTPPMAGGTRKAVPDRHDRRRQQRVAGALRPAAKRIAVC